MTRTWRVVGHSLASLVFCSVSHVLAQDVSAQEKDARPRGLVAPTLEDLAWRERHMSRTDRVLPNALARERTAEALRARGRGGDAGQDAPPPSVDNSALPSFPPIRHQGLQGTCSSFAVAYYTMSYRTALARGWDLTSDPDDRRKFSPKWTSNLINNGMGGSLIAAYRVLLENGGAIWSSWPYNGWVLGDQEELGWPLQASVWRQAADYRVSEAGYVPGLDTTQGLEAAKGLLANGHVLNVASYVDSWDEQRVSDDPATTADDAFVGEWIGRCVSGTVGLDGMTIVGYNDDIWLDINTNGRVDPGEKGAFKIARSFGTTWRNNGFIWLSYDALTRVSSVGGWSGGGAGRQTAFQGSEAYWLTAPASYQPQLFSEFTLNTKDRSQLRVSLGISDPGRPAPTALWEWTAPNRTIPRAFDGTSTAVDATFVLDFSHLNPPVNTAKRYWLKIEDVRADGVGQTLKSFKLLDLINAREQATATALPLTADANALLVYVDYTLESADNDFPILTQSPLATPNPVTLPQTAALSVRATDPLSRPLTYTWRKRNGPGNVAFSANGTGTSFDTTATFGAAGTYGLTVDVSNGVRTTIGHATVVVRSAAVASPDMSGDGRADVAWRHQTTGDVSGWLMHDEVVAATGLIARVSDLNQRIVGVGDVNGDQKADLLWQNQATGDLRLWMMNGLSTAPPVSLGRVSDTNYRIRGLADFGGDGKADILWRHQTSGDLTIWMMNGATVVSTSDVGRVSDTNWVPMGLGDFNADRKADILWRHRLTGYVGIWFMNGGSILSSAGFLADDLAKRIVGVADFNGDGRADILWRRPATGEVSVWLMDGGVVSGVLELGSVPATCRIVGVGDFGGDGKADVLWRYDTGDLQLWIMPDQGAPTRVSAGSVPDAGWLAEGYFDYSETVPAMTSAAAALPNPGAVPDPIALSVFARDAHSLRYTWQKLSGPGTVTFTPNGTPASNRTAARFTTEGTYLLRVDISNGITTVPSSITVVVRAERLAGMDFSADAVADILWRRTSNGSVSVWLMDGTSTPPGGYVGSVSDSRYQIAGVGDFNGDAKADVLWRNNVTGELSLWFMNGTSIASMAGIGSVSDLNYRIVAVGDFNGDTRADVVWRHMTTGVVSIWLMNGATILASGAAGTVTDTNYRIVGTGDFNGDGKADILWRHQTSGLLALWLMSGTAVAGGATPGSVSVSYQIAGIADINADGMADIVWHHTPTGDVSTWWMYGGTILGGTYVGRRSDSAWRIVGARDYNGDGKGDLLWRHQAGGQVQAWLLNAGILGTTISLGTVIPDWVIIEANRQP